MTVRLEPVSFASGDGVTQIPSYLATPAGGGPYPAVLVLRGVAGPDDGYTEIAERLAGWGYVALVHGWFGGAGSAPDVPMDTDVLTEADFKTYVAALEGAGFFGPDSWYMNQARNRAYAAQAKDGGVLSMPVLFLHGEYDATCETVQSRLAEPMRRDCRNLTEVVVPSGHWMAQEKPRMVNAALAKWLAAQLPSLW